MSVAEILDHLDYGPAPESDTEARAWLKTHAAGTQLFIGGEWRKAENGATFETINPGTGEVLARVAEAGESDIDAAVKAMEERHAGWKARLPRSDKDAWDAIQQLDGADQAALFAHCAAYAVNAQWEPVPKHGGGRISAHGVARRVEHANVLARAVGFDMVAAGWRPTVENYLGRVTKPRILEAVAEGTDPQKAGLIDHLKKGDMAREAERLLADSGWLPEPLRMPEVEPVLPIADTPVGGGDAEALPAFLGDEGEDEQDSAYAIAAE